jgi:hypothetical protein
MHRLLFISWLAIGLCTTSVALAQDEGFGPDEQEAEAGGAFAQTDEDAFAESADEPMQNGQQPEEEASAAGQPPIRWFVGAQGRLNLVPAFVQQLFLDEAPTVVSGGFNIVGTHRDADGLSVMFGLGYIAYQGEGPYRAKGDPEEDTEYVDSTLGLVQGTVSLLWSTQFEKWLALEYGFGLDLGVVVGRLMRSEAYKEDGEYKPCNGPYSPPTRTDDLTAIYCEGGPVPYDEEGEHYNVEEERVPPVVAVPSVPHLALRFEPDPHVALKLEVAYGIIDFWFGLSAHYGFDT